MSDGSPWNPAGNDPTLPQGPAVPQGPPSGPGAAPGQVPPGAGAPPPGYGAPGYGPPGGPAGPGYGGPGDLPPDDGEDRRRTAMIVAGVAGAILLIVAVIAVAGGGDDKKESHEETEVVLESFDQPGADPYTASVAKDPADATTTTAGEDETTTSLPPTTTVFKVPPVEGAGVRTYVGGQPGLYGGTRDYHSCDSEKMIEFLEANPAKQRAWAKVQGINPSEVSDYIRSLTSVDLRTDTWVLNHGYSGGRATERAAVLQAGTAVLVDKYGVPRAKCYCGNPLLPPRRYARPRYTGTRWPSFDPQTVVIIQQNTTVINNFTLVNVYGQAFTRPSDGGKDGDGPDKPPVPPSTTPNTIPPTTAAPPTTEAPPGTDPPSTGSVGLTAEYDIHDGNNTGSAFWTADVGVSEIQGAAGAGSGSASVQGVCINTGTGVKVSDWDAEVSFTVRISGIRDGGYFNLQVTRQSANLDSLSYSDEDAPEVVDCRAQAESGYNEFVDKLVQGDLKIADQVGATAPIGAPEMGGKVELI